MCLALPARVKEIDTASDSAIVGLGDVSKQVSLALVEEAQRTLELFAEAGLGEGPP